LLLHTLHVAVRAGISFISEASAVHALMVEPGVGGKGLPMCELPGVAGGRAVALEGVRGTVSRAVDLPGVAGGAMGVLVGTTGVFVGGDGVSAGVAILG
jgi:hypothetical protein